ncbi:hypothetical protein H4582DRAFT_2013162 [Lactarius indigo]|nr:hypothetical protein H4582DRAFT_2013162 [Lactarius indigo]
MRSPAQSHGAKTVFATTTMIINTQPFFQEWMIITSSVPGKVDVNFNAVFLAFMLLLILPACDLHASRNTRPIASRSD